MDSTPISDFKNDISIATAETIKQEVDETKEFKYEATLFGKIKRTHSETTSFQKDSDKLYSGYKLSIVDDNGKVCDVYETKDYKGRINSSIYLSESDKKIVSESEFEKFLRETNEERINFINSTTCLTNFNEDNFRQICSEFKMETEESETQYTFTKNDLIEIADSVYLSKEGREYLGIIDSVTTPKTKITEIIKEEQNFDETITVKRLNKYESSSLYWLIPNGFVDEEENAYKEGDVILKKYEVANEYGTNWEEFGQYYFDTYKFNIENENCKILEILNEIDKLINSKETNKYYRAKEIVKYIISCCSKLEKRTEHSDKESFKQLFSLVYDWIKEEFTV